MFDGSNYPDQHLAHFTSTCGDTVRNDSLLQKFVMALKGLTFDWYSKLSLNFILDYPNMKATFLNHFYSARRTVGLNELSTMEQNATENAINYIR